MGIKEIIGCIFGGVVLTGLIVIGCDTPEVMVRVHSHKKVACVSNATDWKEVPITDPACVEILKNGRYTTVWVAPNWKP
jgi:hypothetical protein